MKKNDLYALACVLGFTACSSPAPDDVEIVKNLFPVQFSVQLQKEILPFSRTRSMPPNTVPEPVQPGEEPDKELTDLCSKIEYVVYEENNQSIPIRHIQYSIDDEPDFGIVYDTLPAGNYQICFLAHQSENTDLSGDIMSFDELTDTFLTTQSVSIGKGEENNVDILLQRIVSRIEFKATDPVPGELEKLEISISNYPNRIHILDSKSMIATGPHLLTCYFSTEDKGQVNMLRSFYTFLPSDNEKLSVILTAIDKNQTVLRTRSIQNIIPQINRIIRYSGILFTPSKPDESENTFQLSVGNNGKWNDPEEIELTD